MLKNALYCTAISEGWNKNSVVAECDQPRSKTVGLKTLLRRRGFRPCCPSQSWRDWARMRWGPL